MATNWDEFRYILKTLLLPPSECFPPTTREDIEEAVRVLTGAFHIAMRVAVPRKSPSKFSKPWLDDEVKGKRVKLRNTPKKSQQHAVLKKLLEETMKQKKGNSFVSSLKIWMFTTAEMPSSDFRLRSR